MFDFLMPGKATVHTSPLLLCLLFASTFPFSQFYNLSALISSSLAPERLLAALTGAANEGILTNPNDQRAECSERKSSPVADGDRCLK